MPKRKVRYKLPCYSNFKTYWLLALIKTFLSTFKCQDKDITSGFADIDIEDETECIDVRDERPQISQPTGALKRRV